MKASIIVPTYMEAENIKPLAERIFNALAEHPQAAELCLAPLASSSNWPVELIIVDDNSPDGIKEVVEALRGDGLPVQLYVRETEKGLSSAVLKGFTEAKGDLLICIDADLQHPPEKIPDMLVSLLKGSEFVLGSRRGGSIDKSWPWYRHVISEGARLMARPLSALSDPMSGFFGVRRDVLERAVEAGIDPIGFKVALEVFVKARVEKFHEVPIVFGVRNAGESKLTGRVIILYLQHLYKLYMFRFPYLLPFILLLLVASTYTILTI